MSSTRSLSKAFPDACGFWGTQQPHPRSLGVIGLILELPSDFLLRDSGDLLKVAAAEHFVPIHRTHHRSSYCGPELSLVLADGAFIIWREAMGKLLPSSLPCYLFLYFPGCQRACSPQVGGHCHLQASGFLSLPCAGHLCKRE